MIPQMKMCIRDRSYNYTTKTVSDFAVIPSEGSLYSNLKYDGVHWIDFFTNNLTAYDEAVPEEQTVRLMNEDMTVEKSAAFAGAWTGVCACLLYTSRCV